MDSMWIQFRRLLLGTVVEILLEEGVQLEFPSLRIAFDGDSEFRVPRLDNYMRFTGSVKAVVLGGLDANSQARVDARLRAVWPEIVKLLEIPVGDRLTEERNQVKLTRTAGPDGKSWLEIGFDLVAD